MKKILLIIFLFPAVLLAAPVDPSLAQQVADNFINAPESDASGTAHRIPRKQKRMARVSKQIASDQQYYIFNSEDGEGFVIISADDVVRPILGYSHTGNFDIDNTPKCVISWLSEYNNQILWAKSNNIQQTEEVSVEWQKLLNGSASNATPVVAPLIQTIWNQAPYYNQYCPYNSIVGQLTVTGCVATAFAQVMRYWQWPLTGNGYHVYNCSFYGTQSAIFGNTTYKWQYMPTELDENSSATQIDAVATLMYHCGVAVDMDYGIALQNSIFGIGDGSGAATAKVADAAKNYFKYSDATQMIYKKDYSETAWKNTLKGQLDNSTPMVYAGGGHAFVCDGYDNQDNFHYNWGWGGVCDGWFPVSSLIPGPNGIGSGQYGDYTSNQRAVINMTPKSVSSSEANLQLASNWTLSSDSIQYGGALAASVTVRNFGSKDFVGDIVAMVLDKDGNFFTDFTVQQNCTIAKNNSKTFTPSVAGNAGLLPGRYYVTLFSRNDDFGYQIIGSEYYLNLTTFKVYYQAEIESYSNFAIYSADNNQLVTGHPSQISLTLKNTGSTNFRGTVALALYTSDLSNGQDYDEISMSLTGIAAGATRTLTFSGTINLDPGTYILALVYRDNNGNFNFAGSTYYSNPIYVIVKAEGEELPEQEPITIKAKMPSNWGTTISAWAWADGSEGSWTTLTKDGDWYSYTSTVSPLNIVFVNGTTWDGDNNQTVDIRVTESTCIQLGTNTGKRTYTVVDCPSDFVLTPGKYVIVANREKDADKNWYYMTSDLGTASTKRFQAVTTGTEDINAICVSELEDKYVWILEADGDNWKLKNGSQYVAWSSGNSANLGSTAKSLTFEVAENQVQAHFNDGTSERYLSLNAGTNNNYFAFYANTNQITYLYFLPYQENDTPEPQPETDNYVILAQRSASSNWFYMTSDLGTASNKRYQAVDAGTSSLAEVNTSNLERKYYWQIEESPQGDKLHTAAGYSTWTSGNSANLDATGRELTIQKQADRTYTFSFEDGDNTRYLSFNKTDGNNYFAFYNGTGQIYKLMLIKEDESVAYTDFKEIPTRNDTAKKILLDGQIFILRGEKTYTLTGQEVK